jgi:glycerol-3-phosphate O-acyltransferase/dihydroxyacetone phosphate acyltransferase
VALVDHQSTEQLRQNREKLSHDITELINEYGPRAFSDFDRKYYPENAYRLKEPVTVQVE